MQRHEPRPLRDRQVQRGEVAETDQELGIAADRFPVEQRQDPRRAPAAPYCEDRAYLRIGEHRVEIARPRGIVPCKIAGGVGDMLAEPGHQAHPADREQRIRDLSL